VAQAEPLHGVFVLERDLEASPLEIYAAFTDPGLRARWVRLPGKAEAENEYRSQLGETEVLRSSMRLEDRVEKIERRTRLVDTVPGQRVVFTYEAVVDDVVRWVSLVAVTLRDAAQGCVLTWTEQYLMLVVTGDGAGDVAHLRGGTELHLNGLRAVAGGEPSAQPFVVVGPGSRMR